MQLIKSELPRHAFNGGIFCLIIGNVLNLLGSHVGNYSIIGGILIGLGNVGLIYTTIVNFRRKASIILLIVVQVAPLFLLLGSVILAFAGIGI